MCIYITYPKVLIIFNIIFMITGKTKHINEFEKKKKTNLKFCGSSLIIIYLNDYKHQFQD